MLNLFEQIGRYVLLMGKVFSKPEKLSIYRRRILFEMDVVDADELLGSVCARDLNAATDAQGIAVLRYLIVLRHVRVEIVLAVERRMAIDLAAEHESAHDCKLDRFLVHDGKSARIAQTHRTHIGVRLATGLQQAAAEHLRVRLQLNMSLKTYRILEFHFQYPSSKLSFTFGERHGESELLAVRPVRPCRIRSLLLDRAQIK